MILGVLGFSVVILRKFGVFGRVFGGFGYSALWYWFWDWGVGFRLSFVVCSLFGYFVEFGCLPCGVFACFYVGLLLVDFDERLELGWLVELFYKVMGLFVWRCSLVMFWVKLPSALF